MLGIAVLLAHGSPALTITDNFTDPSSWGTPFTGGGAMSVGNGRMNYTATGTLTTTGGAAIPRNTPILLTTQDWSMQVNVHVDPFTIAAQGQFADVFLGFGKTGDWFNTHVTFEFDRGWWHSGFWDIGDDVRINGVDAPGLFNVSNLTSADAALRMDYSAANHTITYYFDADGAANGYNWAAQGIANLASGTYNLHLSATDTFTIFLLGSSGYQDVAAGQAYLSNLVITVAAPPPLTLIRSGTNVTLTWPTNAAGFTLQSTTNLAAAAFWTTASPAPVVVNTNNAVTNTISGTRKFYRLSQ
jgi:hypothetical protein